MGIQGRNYVFGDIANQYIRHPDLLVISHDITSVMAAAGYARTGAQCGHASYVIGCYAPSVLEDVCCRRGGQRAVEPQVHAAQGIPVYLIVVMNGPELDSAEEYRLDWSGRNYQLVTVHRHSLITDLPENMKLNISFQQLEQV